MSYLAKWWCTTIHDSPMWPSHGHYQCRTCGREYPVPWELGNTSWRQRNEKLADRGVRFGESIAHATKLTRSS
jgi:hypothetical protein